MTLAGKRIVNTRAVHQAAEFDALIRSRGGEPLAYPCIAVEPPEDTGVLDAALRALADGQFDWLVVTSANTVYALQKRLDALALSLVDQRFKVAAVGPSTAQEIQDQLGLTVDLLPDDYVAEGLAAVLAPHMGNGVRVLLPESAIARPMLAELLAQAGGDVQVMTAYRTVCGDGGVDLPGLLAVNSVDVITFTSSSMVDCFVQRLPDAVFDLLHDVTLIAIGPKTAQTALDHGLDHILTADEYTLTGMLDTLENHYESLIKN